jgi:hypothetical protein
VKPNSGIAKNMNYSKDKKSGGSLKVYYRKYAVSLDTRRDTVNSILTVDHT